ncbi:MAG: 1-acyl-sn-glycerol-3-phosphate acyltransferase [Oscillospiraceae bacterium]|nr:1-acyl-sn-glycerol-3-phosphate acyltransferase [Oscillospiraceae bacterium]
MFFPFVLLSVITTAAICGCSDIMWPNWLWAVPLMFVGFFVAWFLLYVLFLFVVSLFTDPNKEYDTRSKFHHTSIITIVGIILAFYRVKVAVKGAELIPTDSRWLLVGNHRSMFDPIATLWALRKHDLSFVAKPSIFKIPIAKQFLARDFFLAVDRENNREALKTILKSADFIKRDITSMGIYPEGTRSKDGNMLPFRSGAFKIAQRAKVPVVVTTIDNTDIVMKRFPWRSTTVTLTVHTVFDAETVASLSTNELSDNARNIMMAHLGR